MPVVGLDSGLCSSVYRHSRNVTDVLRSHSQDLVFEERRPFHFCDFHAPGC